MLFSPGPNFPEESPIEPCTAQVMQQTGDLILMNPLGSMTQRRGHRCAHTCSPHSMGSIVPGNDAPSMQRMRIVVELHEFGDKGARNDERGTKGRSLCHKFGYARVLRISVGERQCQGKEVT